MSSAAPLSKPNQLHSSEQLDQLLKRVGIKLCLKVSLKPLFFTPLAPWISSLIGLLISTSISNIRCLAVSFAAFSLDGSRETAILQPMQLLDLLLSSCDSASIKSTSQVPPHIESACKVDYLAYYSFYLCFNVIEVQQEK